MCSWCYAFRKVWGQLQSALAGTVPIVRVLGGLAADDDQPMAQAMQQMIQQHWRRIQALVPDTEFNFDFWTECQARRSTYPACRAVIAAANQGQDREEEMIQAIQNAYYRQARNPSDYQTHIELAGEMNLDVEKFRQDLASDAVNDELMRQINLTINTGIPGFPSLVLQGDNTVQAIQHDYQDVHKTLFAIENALN